MPKEKNRLLPFTVGLQILYNTKTDYEGMAYLSWEILLMVSTNGVTDVIMIDI